MRKRNTQSKMEAKAESAKGPSAVERAARPNCLFNSSLSRRVIEGSPLIEVCSPHCGGSLIQKLVGYSVKF